MFTCKFSNFFETIYSYVYIYMYTYIQAVDCKYIYIYIVTSTYKVPSVQGQSDQKAWCPLGVNVGRGTASGTGRGT